MPSKTVEKIARAIVLVDFMFEFYRDEHGPVNPRLLREGPPPKLLDRVSCTDRREDHRQRTGSWCPRQSLTCNHSKAVKFSRTYVARFPQQPGSKSKPLTLLAWDSARSPAMLAFLPARFSPEPSARVGPSRSKPQRPSQPSQRAQRKSLLSSLPWCPCSNGARDTLSEWQASRKRFCRTSSRWNPLTLWTAPVKSSSMIAGPGTTTGSIISRLQTGS